MVLERSVLSNTVFCNVLRWFLREMAAEMV